MPLNVQSLTSKDSKNIFVQIVNKELSDADDIILSKDKKYISMNKTIIDTKTGNKIGAFVFSVFQNDEMQALEIVDIDIILDNNKYTEIKFTERKDNPSDYTESYIVETEDGENHFEVEAVNWASIGSDLTGGKYKAYLSAFPEVFNIYDDIRAFNSSIGFNGPVQIKGTDIKVSGLGESFMSTGDIFSSKKDTEAISFIIGRIKDFRDVSVQLNDDTLDFVIVDVETGVGNMPVAVGRDVFDLSNIGIGKIVEMYTTVKADLRLYRYDGTSISEENKKTEVRFDNNRYDLDFKYLPQIFYGDKKGLIKSILTDGENKIYKIFDEYYQKIKNRIKKEQVFKRSDFKVTDFAVTKTNHVLYVDLPKDLEKSRSYCSAYAFTYSKTLFGMKNIRFFTVEYEFEGTSCIGSIEEDGSHSNYGDASEDIQVNVNRISRVVFC